MNNNNKDVYTFPVSINSWKKTKPNETPEDYFTIAWTIEKFNSRPERPSEALNSPQFIMQYHDSEDIKWRLRVYPKGIISRHFLSVFLDYLSNAYIKGHLS